MSSHDMVHASERNPRGVYRSAAEVPPRPNASGAAMTYRGFQTKKHAGTAVAPGSFPADYFETLEDAFLEGLGLVAPFDPWRDLIVRRGVFTNGDGPVLPGPMPVYNPRPNTVPCSPGDMAMENAHWDSTACRWVPNLPVAPLPAQTVVPTPPSPGPTSIVNQPPATPIPLPPAPSIPVASAPPISPTPAPIVATNQAVPLNDGSGNWLNLSTGTVIPASAVVQNPATGQMTAPSTGGSVAGAMSWLEQNTIFSAFPNWGVLAGGLLLASMMFKGKR